ncbi:MAG: tetratricopeptide repeat protein [Gammaproteobacteria bacterium AqS3]|nr:tetratricopeptide repeat protein [Gammaproteobacteria bacterium AqS3]
MPIFDFLDTLEWQEPLWLLLLLTLPMLYSLALRLGASRWGAYIDASLLGQLLESPRRHLIALGLCSFMTLTAVALAGPSWLYRTVPLIQRSDILAIGLDLSTSMRAQDLAPSRLVRANLKIRDALRLHDGEVMLTVWSGSAHLVLPPTDDDNAVSHLLGVLDPMLMPDIGDEPATAIDLMIEHIPPELRSFSRILLITDGSTLSAIERLRQAIISASVPVSILALGTDTGGAIADQRGRFISNPNGDARIHKPNFKSLEDLASATGSLYRRADLYSDDDLLMLLKPETSTERAESGREIRVLADTGPYLLPLIVLLAALLLGRGALPGISLALLLWLPAPQALAEDSPWRNDNSNAWERLRQGDADGAAELFSDPEWRAIALYRSGEYQRAAEMLAGMSSERALYNLGNALAHLGDLQGAASAWSGVLELNPDHEDAAHNLSLLEQEEQEGQQQNSSDSEESDQEGQSQSAGGEQQQGEGQSGQMGRGQQGQGEQRQGRRGEQQDGDEQDGEEQRTAQSESEDGESDEYQLNRTMQLQFVEPDPGGLLRERFLHQNRKRRQR